PTGRHSDHRHTHSRRPALRRWRAVEQRWWCRSHRTAHRFLAVWALSPSSVRVPMWAWMPTPTSMLVPVLTPAPASAPARLYARPTAAAVPQQRGVNDVTSEWVRYRTMIVSPGLTSMYCA